MDFYSSRIVHCRLKRTTEKIKNSKEHPSKKIFDYQ